MMEVSTATILDAHVAHLEREARILIYDIDDIGKLDRGTDASIVHFDTREVTRF